MLFFMIYVFEFMCHNDHSAKVILGIIQISIDYYLIGNINLNRFSTNILTIEDIIMISESSDI